MIRNRSFVLLLLLFTIAPALRAQWQNTYGPSGKDITGLAAIGTNIFAGNNNGVFLWSGDTDWFPAGLPGSGIQTLVTNGNYLIAGTSGGLCVSTDNGADWIYDTTGSYSPYIFAFTFSGPYLVIGTDNGVYISGDGGAIWETSSDSVDEIFALASSGSNLIAGTEGILLSTDNGATWNTTNNALSGIDVFALAVSGNTIFAGTTDTGVFISNDNGATWNAANNGLTDSNIYAITVIGTKVFVGTDSGVFLSTNNGTNWLAVNDSLPEFTSVESFTTDGNYLYAGTSDGVWRRGLVEFNGLNDGVSQIKSEQPFSVYPNPFSQSTNISFTSPASGDARITIVNILGAEVTQIFSGELSAGEHSFPWNANEMPAGMYECIIQMNGQIQQVPIILEK